MSKSSKFSTLLEEVTVIFGDGDTYPIFEDIVNPEKIEDFTLYTYDGISVGVINSKALAHTMEIQDYLHATPDLESLELTLRAQSIFDFFQEQGLKAHEA